MIMGEMNRKVLYVSDLDGTLMRNDLSISGFTVETINRLVNEGMAFTYATARSIESAGRITKGLHLKLPVITRNGAVLADNNTGRYLEKAVFRTIWTSIKMILQRLLHLILKDYLQESPVMSL